MLHALYNLPAGEKRKKLFVVWANSKVLFHTIRSLWVVFGLSHFISYLLFLVCSVTDDIFASPVSFSPHCTEVNIQCWKMCSGKAVEMKSMFKFSLKVKVASAVENGTNLSRDWRFMARSKLAYYNKISFIPCLFIAAVICPQSLRSAVFRSIG